MRRFGVTLVLLALTSFANAGEEVDAQARAIKAFESKVQEYASFRERLRSRLPPLEKAGDPAAIGLYQKALAKAIVDARANAAQGDVFLMAVQPVFRTVIAAEFEGPAGERLRETLREDLDEDTEARLVAFSRAVNAGYPDGA